MSPSIVPNVPADLPPKPSRLSNRLTPHTQHNIPYLLRSRTSRLPPAAHNVKLTSPSLISSNSSPPSHVSFDLPRLQNHIHPTSDIFPIVPAISVSSQPLNIHNNDSSLFYDGHCPFFPSYLYILLFSYRIL